MTQKVALPDGRAVDVNIPMSVPKEEVQRIVGQMYMDGKFGSVTTGDINGEGAFSQTQNKVDTINDMGGGGKFISGFGQGVATVGRGIAGDGRSELEQTNDRLLTQESDLAAVGSVVGAAATLLPTMMFGGAALTGGRALTALGGSAEAVLVPAAQSLLARLGIQGGIGAAEGAVLARGAGGDGNDTAGGAVLGAGISAAGELLIPMLGRLGNHIMAKLGKTPRGALIDAAGLPTRELTDALEQVGMSFDDLTEDAVDFIATMKPGMAKEHIERAARFKQEEVPFTRADMTQSYPDQAAEQRLLGMAVNPDAAPLREFKRGQSQAFEARVNRVAEQFGNPGEAGETIKSALASRDRILFERKQALYGEAFAKAPQLSGVEIIPDGIVAAMPSPAEMRRLKNVMPSETGKALDDLMVEFGLETDDELVEAFLNKRGNALLPLTMETAEEFRQGLLRIQRADTTGAASVAIRPMVDALDTELDGMADMLADYGMDVGPEVLETLKAARATVRQRATEFSPASLAGRLIGVNKDGATPLVEASRVFGELKGKPVEQLELTLKSLFAQGDEGRKAIGNMKAAVMTEALDAALKAPSRKDGGLVLASGEQFAKYLERTFGKDRLDVLFKGDPEGLANLQRLAQVAKDISPPNAAVQKGSGAMNLDIINSIINAPGLAIVMRRARDLLMTGSEARAGARAMNITEPDVRQLSAFASSFPGLAAAIGVPTILEQARAEMGETAYDQAVGMLQEQGITVNENEDK